MTAPSDAKPPRVFISYASRDSAFQRRLAADLRVHGVIVSADPVDVGEPIVERIHEAIRNSDHFIAVISSSSVESKWVREELNAATFRNVSEESRFIVPVLLDDISLPLPIAHLRFADFRTDYDVGLHQVLTRLGQPAREIPPPSRAPAVIITAIVAVVVLLAAGAIALWRGKRSDDSMPPGRAISAAEPLEKTADTSPPQRGRWIYIGSYFGKEQRWTERKLDFIDPKTPQGLRCTESVIAMKTGDVNVRSLPSPSAETVGQLDPGAAVTLLEIRDVGNGAQWARIASDAADQPPDGESIDFVSVDVAKRPGYVAPAAPVLYDHRIRVLALRPKDAVLVVKHPLALYKGEVLHENRSVLTVDALRVEPVSFTLSFPVPLQRVAIRRAALFPASDSGITHPAWSAHALDRDNREVAATREPFLAEHCNVPARIFVLGSTGAPITAVRFDSDPRRARDGGAAFYSVLIDELILQTAEHRQ